MIKRHISVIGPGDQVPGILYSTKGVGLVDHVGTVVDSLLRPDLTKVRMLR